MVSHTHKVSHKILMDAATKINESTIKSVKSFCFGDSLAIDTIPNINDNNVAIIDSDDNIVSFVIKSMNSVCSSEHSINFLFSCRYNVYICTINKRTCVYFTNYIPVSVVEYT